LGKRVHALRAAKKWSQEEFAHISGLHRTYIGQIERGEKNISFGNLSKLLSGLENGDKLIAMSSGRQESGTRRMKIEKLVRQLRVQYAATDRAVTSLEELVFASSPAAKRPATRRRSLSSGKA
jgi:transcriptional regulator with XRE-family HTH domain